MPTSDLASYSSEPSTTSADLGGDGTPPPTRPPVVGSPDDERPTPSDEAPGSSEEVKGNGAALDPNTTNGPSGVEDDAEEPADPDVSPASEPDAGPPVDAGSPPVVVVPPVVVTPPAEPEPDPEPPRPLACSTDETTGPNGRCYVLVASQFAWDAARANCQQRGVGWDLTSIRSTRDSAFLLGLLAGEAWVGGSDATTEATWAWVNDGSQFWQGEGEDGQALNGAFVNWYEDEPNGTTSSQCMRLLTDARWADLECAELRQSICEGPKR